MAARGFTVKLAAVAAAGVALRALYLFTIGRDVDGIGDWHFYHWQANLIADGHGFIEPYKWMLEQRVSPSAGHPPLYPAALSVVSWLGGTGELSHRALGLLVAPVTIALVGLLGRRAGGERVGLVAAGLCAVYPVMVLVDGALMSETLYGALVAAVLLAAYAVLDRPTAWRALALGALIGLAALTRSEALLFVPLLGFALAWRARRWAVAGATVAGFAVVLAPWAIRNASAFDRPVLISTNDATVLAGANCPLTYAGNNLGSWDLRCISERRADNEAEQAEIWRREGTDYARDHAGRVPVVAAVRLLRVWDLWQPRRQVEFAEGRHKGIQEVAVGIWFVLAALAIAGAVALRRRGAPLLVLLAPAVAVCVGAVLGYGVPRLRHAFEIPLLVLAAAGLLAATEALRARRA
jgi:4-amino-4-deoxy-L-arabinose transferase-like glycosyltransferase